MTLKINHKPSNKLVAIIIGVAFSFFLLMATTITTYAIPSHGFGTGQGRTDSVRENDYHTASWERFSYNYQFTSGSDHRFELGRPTTFNDVVPIDVFTVNTRSDANVSLRPPSYGTFSGNFHTPPSNNFFTQPNNPNFYHAIIVDSGTTDPRFDTLGHGVNAPAHGNQMNMFHVSDGHGFLPPTSTDMMPR